MRVRLTGVTKIFDGMAGTASPEGVRAVDDVSLDVAEGEFVTLLGPSGCGKTTTLRMIAGFETPTKGDIHIGEERVNDIPPNRRDTTMVFQSYAIFPHMSVEQNIGFGLELKGAPRALIAGKVAEILGVMNLGALAKRRPDQLSGGQQQRVALARAIVNRPGVLLFDEPLSNLDAKLRESMRLEIRRIQQTFGITSIYVTHDQAEAMTVSDRIVVMDRGRIMQVGTPFDIYSRPDSMFVADFIGRVNFFRGRTRASPGTARTFVSDGLELEVDNSAGGVRTGEDATLAVRPESLDVRALGMDESRPHASSLRGRVVKSVYLGATVEYEIDTGGDRPVLAVTHDPVRSGFFSPGETVEVIVPSKAARLVPAGS